MPELPGWAGRSISIERIGSIDFLHYDPYGQAFAKVARSHPRDRADVSAMVNSGLVEPARLFELFETVRERLLRYPSLDAEVLERRLRGLLDAAD